MNKKTAYKSTTFGYGVKGELLRQGKSISWLAKQTGISPCMMSYYLSGKTDPPLTKALRIADTLRAPLSFLVGVDGLDSQSLIYLMNHDDVAQEEYLKTLSLRTLAQEVQRRKNNNPKN